MKKEAVFTIIENNPRFILIRDDCNMYGSKSVTNDAENVVQKLMKIAENKYVKFYYIDTMGYVDILEHDEKGNFLGFTTGYSSWRDFDAHKLSI